MRPGITVENDTNEILFVRYRDTGDETAFARLYESLGQRLFAIGVRFFRNRHAAPDVRAMASDAAHETWVRVIEKKHQWSGSPGSFGPWITSIHYYCLVAMSDRRSVNDSVLRVSGSDRSASGGHAVSPNGESSRAKRSSTCRTSSPQKRASCSRCTISLGTGASSLRRSGSPTSRSGSESKGSRTR